MPTPAWALGSGTGGGARTVKATVAVAVWVAATPEQPSRIEAGPL